MDRETRKKRDDLLKDSQSELRRELGRMPTAREVERRFGIKDGRLNATWQAAQPRPKLRNETVRRVLRDRASTSHARKGDGQGADLTTLRERRQKHYDYLLDNFLAPLANANWLQMGPSQLLSSDPRTLPFHLDPKVAELVNGSVFGFAEEHLSDQTREFLKSLPSLLVAEESRYRNTLKGRRLGGAVKDTLAHPSLSIPIEPSHQAIASNSRVRCVLLDGMVNWVRKRAEELVESVAYASPVSDLPVLEAKPVGSEEPENHGRIYSDRRDVIAVHVEDSAISPLAEELAARARSALAALTPYLSDLGGRARRLRERCDEAKQEVAVIREELRAGAYNRTCSKCPS